MSAAQKYGHPVESLSPESLQQMRSAGQSLADRGVTQPTSLGSGAPAHTPAMKYGSPVATNAMGRSLSQDAPGRSL